MDIFSLFFILYNYAYPACGTQYMYVINDMKQIGFLVLSQQNALENVDIWKSKTLSWEFICLLHSVQV